MKRKGSIAAGHSETAKAAALMLENGGNAFDAIVAAHFTACVAEPVLTSLGGGGFLMAAKPDLEPVVYDFFVQTPYQTNQKKPDFYPIMADFGSAKQEFHIGTASVATPGTVRGLFRVHEELCTMPMTELVQPAVLLARNGIKVNSFQADIMNIVAPIFLAEKESRSVFTRATDRTCLLGAGETLRIPELANFLEVLALEGEDFFYEGEVSARFVDICRDRGGFLTDRDFWDYKVVKRKPLDIIYKENRLWLNPPPSSGGILTAFALRLFEGIKTPPSLKTFMEQLVQIQSITEKARVDIVAKNESCSADEILNPDFMAVYRQDVLKKMNALKGTTHISVADSLGNFASLTTSNGEGSGVMIPGTGIMMNNMLGEEDLNPAGFHNWPKNERMTSMMSPGMIITADGKQIVFGSGGSTRIRTAILQFLLYITELDMSPEEAVEASRVHSENGLLNIEHGFDEDLVHHLQKKYPVHKLWNSQSLFFGGTNIVCKHGNSFTAKGDQRRGGVSVVLK